MKDVQFSVSPWKAALTLVFIITTIAYWHKTQVDAASFSSYLKGAAESSKGCDLAMKANQSFRLLVYERHFDANGDPIYTETRLYDGEMNLKNREREVH